MKRLALAFALLALTPASASAQRVATPQIVTKFTDAGDPHISVNSLDQTVEALRRCPPGGAPCEAIPLGSQPWHQHELGETAAGTVFEADLRSSGGVATTIRSVPWQGRVTVVEPPAVAGEATVGATVTAVDGRWSGGWGERPSGEGFGNVVGDRSDTWLIVCRTPDRQACWTPLSGPLEQRWAGWYLFAVAYRSDGEAYGEGIPVQGTWPFATPARVRVAQTIAYSAPVQVCCTLPAPAADTTPAPTVTLRSRAVRSNGRLLLGRVDCAIRCSVGLTASGGGRTLKRSFTVEGTKALSIPRRSGRLSVRVRVDGKLLETSRVTAR